MVNRKFFLAVVVAILIGLISAIQVNAGDVKKININTATAGELMRLDGVGPKYASRIIEYREKYGPFKTPEEENYHRRRTITQIEAVPNYSCCGGDGGRRNRVSPSLAMVCGEGAPRGAPPRKSLTVLWTV